MTETPQPSLEALSTGDIFSTLRFTKDKVGLTLQLLSSLYENPKLKSQHVANLIYLEQLIAELERRMQMLEKN